MLDVKRENSLGYGYAKDNLHGFFEGKKFKVLNVATLVALSGEFVRDDREAYFQCKRIIGSDGKTFHLIDSTYNYAKDSKFSYFYQTATHEIKIIPCRTSTFHHLEGSFSTDDLSVFFEYYKLKDADSKTFQIVDEGFSKDEHHVYFKDKLLLGARATAFKILKENSSVDSYNTHFSTDGELVFWEGSVLSNANASTFLALPKGYGKDGGLVFYQNIVVVGADAKTFNIMEGGLGDAADLKNKFLEGQLIKD